MPATGGVASLSLGIGATPSLPTGIGVVAAFAVGLLAGVHCLGMCGPLVTLYADRMADGRGSALTFHEIRQHALFNLGRTASYATAGVLLGGLGALAFEAAALAAVGDLLRAVVGLAVGGAVVAVGVGYVGGGAAGHGVPDLPYLGSAVARVQGWITGRVDGLVDGPGILALGAVHGVLPCPILYPAYLYAVSTGSPLEGGLTLAALGLGTFPTLFLYGTAVGAPATETRERLHRALGVVFVLFGAIPLLQGLSLLGVPVPTPPLPMPEFPT